MVIMDKRHWIIDERPAELPEHQRFPIDPCPSLDAGGALCPMLAKNCLGAL